MLGIKIELRTDPLIDDHLIYASMNANLALGKKVSYYTVGDNVRFLTSFIWINRSVMLNIIVL